MKSKIVQDAVKKAWAAGTYKDIQATAKAHNMAFGTAKLIIDKSGIEWGADAALVKSNVENYFNEPNITNAQKLSAIQSVIPIYNLFDLEALQEHSNGLVADEIIELMKTKLVNSNVILANVRANHMIRQNEKTVMHKDLGHVVTPLSPSDLLTMVEIADKSLVALGVVPRFNDKAGVSIENNNNLAGTVKYEARLPEETEAEPLEVEPLRDIS